MSPVIASPSPGVILSAAKNLTGLRANSAKQSQKIKDQKLKIKMTDENAIIRFLAVLVIGILCLIFV
jgi:hypothetical protein